MVPNPRATARADQLRPLNQPRPVQVLTQDGRLTALIDGDRRHPIKQVQDTWAIEDEWWRQPISRRYHRLVLENEVVRTVYHDTAEDIWYAQEY